jgi:outer membrane lipoprotein-sorting protein
VKRSINLSIIFALLFVSSAGAQQTSTPTAQQIVEQMFSAYTSCKTYQDTGEVRTVTLENGRRRTTLLPFSTAFVRPANFRYEFRSRRGEAEWDQYVLWRQGDVVKSWWSIRPGIITDRSFSMSVSGASGVSGKSALTVPSMLMPDELRANPIKALTGLTLAGEESIGSQGAYKIEGKDFRGYTTTIWIEKQRLLLLQIFEKRKLSTPDGKGEFETETTTVYNPQVNEDVPAAKLAFDPPIQKQ